MIRKIVSKFIGFCVPELKPLINNRVSIAGYENIEKNVEKNDLVRLVSPYKVINCKIGKGTYISVNSSVSETSIGKFCSIGPNFLCGWGIHPTNGLSTSPYFYSTKKQNGSSIAKENLFEERKRITIGNDVFIGANVTVLDGVNIGDGAIIGAGSVVSKHIPDYAIAYGNPIEIKKYRFSEEQRVVLKKIAWWDFDEEELQNVNKYFFDIDEFIKKYNN